MAPDPTEPSFADLVVCTDLALAATFAIADRVGLIAEHRKRDARVLYVGPDRTVWLPFRALRPAKADEARTSPLEPANRLARLLGGTSIELSAPGGEAIRIVMRHGAITPERIDEVRALMGPRLAAWKIRPGSMSRLESVLELRAAGPARDTGGRMT